jgi:hypothetical protein
MQRNQRKITSKTNEKDIFFFLYLCMFNHSRPPPSPPSRRYAEENARLEAEREAVNNLRKSQATTVAKIATEKTRLLFLQTREAKEAPAPKPTHESVAAASPRLILRVASLSNIKKAHSIPAAMLAASRPGSSSGFSPKDQGLASRDSRGSLLDRSADVGSSDKASPRPADSSSISRNPAAVTSKAYGKVAVPLPPSPRNRTPFIALSDIPSIKAGDVEFDDAPELGRGAFGAVRKGKWTGTPVAIKCFESQFTLNGRAKKAISMEAAIMVFLRHPHIVTLFGVCLDDGQVMMVMELCAGGSLYSLLGNKQNTLNWPQRLKVLHDIACGLNYLHSLPTPVLHRDIKSHNVLLARAGWWADGGEEEPEAKLADFGLSYMRTELELSSSSGAMGTKRWVAPEVVQRKGKNSLASDVWSFGLLCVEVCTCEIPYGLACLESDVDENLNDANASNLSLNLPRDVPPLLREIISGCTERNPALRPSIKECVDKLAEAQVAMRKKMAEKAAADKVATASRRPPPSPRR